MTGVPRAAGDYLISCSPAHTDGLRVFPDGSLLFFPSDPVVSEFALTGDHAYVQANVLSRVEKLPVIRLHFADVRRE